MKIRIKKKPLGRQSYAQFLVRLKEYFSSATLEDQNQEDETKRTGSLITDLEGIDVIIKDM